MTPFKIESLVDRPDLLPTVAGWIYQEWWAGAEDASVGKVMDLLQAHLVPGRIPLTLVALQGAQPAGTATLLAHDIGTEEWPQLSPWLAAVYVSSDFRSQGIGASLVNAIVSHAGALGNKELYLLTLGRESFYAQLGWTVFDRAGKKTVMSTAPASAGSA